VISHAYNHNFTKKEEKKNKKNLTRATKHDFITMTKSHSSHLCEHDVNCDKKKITIN